MKHPLKIFLFLTGVLLLTLVACNKKPPSLDVFGNVVIETENGFKFHDLGWLTEFETIEEDIPEAVYSEKLERLEVQESFEDEQRHTLYYFDDNQFTSGHYLIVLEEASDYETYLSEIKDEAESYFTEHQPMNEDLDELLDNQSVQWEGRDKSYFRISTTEDGDKYTIRLQVSAPQEVQDGLD